MSTTRRLIASCMALVIVAGCGVPTGPESFEAIDDSDVPNRLNEATTTTTTTTVPPTTSTVATTTLPDQQETTTTTTEPEPPTETVDVFFVSRGELTSKPIQVLAPVSANELIVLLEADPPSVVLDTEIPPDLIDTTSVDNGVLTIAFERRGLPEDSGLGPTSRPSLRWC